MTQPDPVVELLALRAVVEQVVRAYEESAARDLEACPIELIEVGEKAHRVLGDHQEHGGYRAWPESC
jgi:hypothetical protein